MVFSPSFFRTLVNTLSQFYPLSTNAHTLCRTRACVCVCRVQLSLQTGIKKRNILYLLCTIAKSCPLSLSASSAATAAAAGPLDLEAAAAPAFKICLTCLPLLRLPLFFFSWRGVFLFFYLAYITIFPFPNHYKCE